MATMQRVGTTATTVVGNRQRLIITYHHTEVVRVEDDMITLNSGGWRTATTKARMNQVSNQYDLGFGVYAKAGKWYVNTTTGTQPYADGMTFPLH